MPTFSSWPGNLRPTLFDIASYHGLLMDRPHNSGYDKKFKKKYPGILTLDASSLPLHTDKYKMSLLFAEDPLLESFKPKWKVYPKHYTPGLAAQIQRDLQCETFVIKPRGAFLGKGVIIVRAR